jgi:alpha-tubulin suppressor-like RCC1 family protein
MGHPGSKPEANGLAREVGRACMPRSSPAARSGVKVTALTSSWGGSGALLAEGSYYNWGYNAAGQLGDGTTANSDLPVRVRVPAGVTFVTVDAGGYTSFAIDSAGRLWAWGGNDNGQLGTGSAKRRATLPVDAGNHLSQVVIDGEQRRRTRVSGQNKAHLINANRDDFANIAGNRGRPGRH